MWFALICYDLLLFSPLSMGARLVSKEWEIEILRWSRLITLNLYRMEPPASTRWDQIATGTPLKNASFQTLKTHKTQISKESWGPGSPFPWGNSKGEYFLFFLFHRPSYEQSSPLHAAKIHPVLWHPWRHWYRGIGSTSAWTSLGHQHELAETSITQHNMKHHETSWNIMKHMKIWRSTAS